MARSSRWFIRSLPQPDLVNQFHSFRGPHDGSGSFSRAAPFVSTTDSSTTMRPRLRRVAHLIGEGVSAMDRPAFRRLHPGYPIGEGVISIEAHKRFAVGCLVLIAALSGLRLLGWPTTGLGSRFDFHLVLSLVTEKT